MTKWVNVVLAILFSLSFLPTQAQSVDEVINKYIDAMGGREKLNSIKTLYMEGVAVMQNGSEINTKIWRADKQLVRSETSFGMGSMTSIITKDAGWFSNPRNGGKFEPMPAERLKTAQSELDIAGPYLDYAAKGEKAEMLGKEDVNGVSCFKVKLTMPDGREQTDYFDANTFYLVRDVRKAPAGGMRPGAQQQPPQGNGELTIDYSDYKKTPDGFVFPYSITRVGMGGTMTYEKIEVNKPVDVAKLSKPEN
jgi:hypothetical protein